MGIDADTVIAIDAISKLIPHFEDARVGAVAGNAKVGNRVNLWTRWQALEYITSQNFERRALDLFNVVTVVPGAIGAWRTAGVKAAGGYPINTVAEDADLTMNLLEQKYKVVYEDRALAFTEAPIDARGLMRQRFRWSFGILQAVWKHRLAFIRNKAMGLFALPNILILQMRMLGSAKSPSPCCDEGHAMLPDCLQNSEGPAEALPHEPARIDGGLSKSERAIFVDHLVVLLQQIHGQVGIFGDGVDRIAAGGFALPRCAMRRWRRERP